MSPLQTFPAPNGGCPEQFGARLVAPFERPDESLCERCQSGTGGGADGNVFRWSRVGSGFEITSRFHGQQVKAPVLQLAMQLALRSTLLGWQISRAAPNDQVCCVYLLLTKLLRAAKD